MKNFYLKYKSIITGFLLILLLFLVNKSEFYSIPVILLFTSLLITIISFTKILRETSYFFSHIVLVLGFGFLNSDTHYIAGAILVVGALISNVLLDISKNKKN
ncbi:hypothetical protein [Tenacibaculum sp. 190524A02b]|uniref:hypothetical protein n=1 Tax=Tenacibaculum vairaonense TaxID=3137860 RepID=UPI0031FA550A